MDSAPLVSVVIPTYKRPQLLPRAINAVQRQTYKNLEILVVDDGSQDQTEQVVRSIADARIRYVPHPVNRGLPAARNTGVDHARGEYIAFLDDDDDWRDDKLEKQLRAIGGHGAVLSMAVANGRPLRIHRKPTVSLDDLRRGSFDPSSLLARASVLKELRFDETLRHGEDWDAFIRIAQNYSIGWVDEPLLLYNDGTHARMTTETLELAGAGFAKRTAVLNKHRAFFGERWFRYHIAGTLLAYIGRRPHKIRCIAQAAKSCGIAPVARVLADKVRERTWDRWRVLVDRRPRRSSAFYNYS